MFSSNKFNSNYRNDHKLCHPAAGGASDVKGAVHNLGPGIEARGGGYDGEKDDDGEQDEG